MKTNISFNIKENIEVSFGTWISINEHLPELDKEFINYDGNPFSVENEDDCCYFFEENFNKHPDEFVQEWYDKASVYVNKVIIGVKKMTGQELSFNRAIKYCSLYDINGFSESVIVFGKKNGDNFFGIMELRQKNYNSFSFEDEFNTFMSFEKINGKIKINDGYKGIISHWMPFPKYLGYKSIDKPKDNALLILSCNINDKNHYLVASRYRMLGKHTQYGFLASENNRSEIVIIDSWDYVPKPPII